MMQPPFFHQLRSRTAAGRSADAKAVVFRGPKHPRELSARSDLEEILSDRVFLTYAANGKTLPQRHGFPVRLVAEDHYGGRWIKYGCRIRSSIHNRP
jgi:sulfoxide reductase catalytic subunit YedY